MKKMLVLCLCMALFLSGCGKAAPPKAADGADWSEDWVTLGSVIGVDTPEGLTARENSDVLSAKGMYYASWSAGESVPYVNEDGEEVQLYDAQVYLLAAVIIGEAVFGKVFHNFGWKLIGVACGSVLYYIVVQTVIWMGIDTDLLKLLSALVVAVFLAIPHLKEKYIHKPVVRKGGNNNA